MLMRCIFKNQLHMHLSKKMFKILNAVLAIDVKCSGNAGMHTSNTEFFSELSTSGQKEPKRITKCVLI